MSLAEKIVFHAPSENPSLIVVINNEIYYARQSEYSPTEFVISRKKLPENMSDEEIENAINNAIAFFVDPAIEFEKNYDECEQLPETIDKLVTGFLEFANTSEKPSIRLVKYKILPATVSVKKITDAYVVFSAKFDLNKILYAYAYHIYYYYWWSRRGNYHGPPKELLQRFSVFMNGMGYPAYETRVSDRGYETRVKIIHDVTQLEQYLSSQTVPGGQPQETPSTQETPSDLQYVDISRIEIPSWAREVPRDYMQESVKSRGVIVPVILAKTPDDRLILVDGRGRIEIAKSRGDTKVPARIIPVNSEEEAILLAIEMEKTKKEWSHSYMLRLINHLLSKGYSKTKIAEMLKISRSVLYRYLYATEIYNNLSDELKEMFIKELDEDQIRLRTFEEINTICNQLGITLADFARIVEEVYEYEKKEYSEFLADMYTVSTAISHARAFLNMLIADEHVAPLLRKIAEKLNITQILEKIREIEEKEKKEIEKKIEEHKEVVEKVREELAEEVTEKAPETTEEVETITVELPETPTEAPKVSEAPAETEKPKPLDVDVWLNNLVDGILEHIQDTLDEIDETEHKIEFLVRLKEKIEILINELSVSG